MSNYSSSGESCGDFVAGQRRDGTGQSADICGGTEPRQHERGEEWEERETRATLGRDALAASQKDDKRHAGDFLTSRPFKQYTRIIVWFRRDLRLTDNPALLAASLLAEEVVCIYVYAPEEDGQFQPGRYSRWWLKNALGSLERELRETCNARLLFFRSSDSGRLLANLVDDMQADGVFFNHLYDPISMVRDNEVKTLLRRNNIVCQSFNCDTLREPWSVVDVDSNAYSSFESFWSAHQDEGRLGKVASPAPRVDHLCDGMSEKTGVSSGLSRTRDAYRETLEDVEIISQQEGASNAQLEVHWTPGRAGGMKVLQDFVDGRLGSFSNDKAKTDRKSTSRISPYLHYGEIGVREVLDVVATWEAKNMKTNKKCHAHALAFRKQLGYREYSRYLSFHYPFTHERAMLEHLRAVPWRYDQRLFKAWRTGNTGYPIVDAAMREIWSTGWMHNRCRVVCASFLVKYLLLPWQWGLKHFWDALLDADLECDALGWQYCAGCLTDGHEFSMVMDLEQEVQKYDPKGMYVRRWIPSLARLPMEYVHCPWRAPPEVLEHAGVELGEDYPWPVVEFEVAKETVSKVAEFVVQQSSRSELATGETVAGIAGSASTAAIQDTLKSPYKPATTPIDGAISIEDIIGGVSTDSMLVKEPHASASPSAGSITRSIAESIAGSIVNKAGQRGGTTASATNMTDVTNVGRADRKRAKT